MAEDKHRLTTSIIWVIGLIFICGMTYMQINNNSEDIKENRNDIKDNRAMISSEKEQRLLTQGTINATADDVKEIKDDFKEIQKYLMQYDFKPKDK